jgi:replicative DNA helicase
MLWRGSARPAVWCAGTPEPRTADSGADELQRATALINRELPEIALHVAEQHGPVVFISIELTDVDLTVRLVSVITNIRKEQLVTGKITREQSDEVMAAIERLSRSRMHIVSGSGYTSPDVRACALQVQAAEGTRPAVLVVDYVRSGARQTSPGPRRASLTFDARGCERCSAEPEAR